MRLFTAIDLPEHVTAGLEELLKRLRPAARLQWSRVQNLHITTKFIGDWPDERIREAQGALDALEAPGAIDIAVRGLGWFPNQHRPRVFWAGVQASESLADLARSIDRALAAIGIPAEDRPFSPHLTLARVKDPVPLAGLRAAIDALESTEFGAFRAASFHLYRSQLAPGGSIYTKLAQFSLIRS